MRCHAKGQPPEKTTVRAARLGGALGGALVTPDASGSVNGRGTPSARPPLLLAIAVGILLAVSVAPAAALAGQTRLPTAFSPLTGSGSGVTIHAPSGIAIDEATGNVFVTDDNGSEDAILILNGEGGGTPPVGLAPNGSGEYKLAGVSIAPEFEGEALGLAYDNSGSVAHGTLYFFEAASIRKFVRNPLTEQYEPAGEIPVPGTENGAGLTVDEEGNIWLADFGSQQVREFSPTGALLHQYDFTFTPSNRPSAIAVDTSGNLYVQGQGGGGVYRYPVTGSGEIEVSDPEKVTDLSAIGVAYDPSSDHVLVTLERGAVAEFSVSSLELAAEYGEASLGGVLKRLAVNSTTDRVYVADASFAEPKIAVFGSLVPLPDVTTKAPLEVTGTTATLNGTVNPQGVEVTECQYEYGLTTSYGQTAPCEGAIPTDSADHSVTAALTGLQPDHTTYHYRLVVNSTNGEVKGVDRTLVTSQTAATEPATGVTSTAAMLHGTVLPEGSQLTECFFEWGKTTLYGQTEPCSPSAGSIPDDFSAHSVSAGLSGLQPNTTYHFRLVKANASATTLANDLTFTTQGPPVVVEQRPLEVEQTTAVLRAKINPGGKPTTYHFEWGEGTSYDRRIPADHELFAGGGDEVVSVSANVASLSPATAYSFRIVAENSYGRTVGPDQPFETLNVKGLPDNRGFELVSPADKRPTGNMEQLTLTVNQYQVSETGDRIGFLVLNGLESSPAGGESVLAGNRGNTGWSSTEITPPSLVNAPEGVIGGASPSYVKYLDPYNLACAVIETFNPLTADTPTVDREFAVSNLYRWNAATDTYTLITNRAPLNPSEGRTQRSYGILGVSEDCSQIFFRSDSYIFEAGSTGLYEWDQGTLRDAGIRPDGSTPGSSEIDTANVLGEDQDVSLDGSYFFTARSNEGADAGQPAVFARRSPTEVVDVSAPTAGPTLGARYNGASPDGSRVVFLANYGIADTSSSGPIEDCSDTTEGGNLTNLACDLYVYDLVSEELTDITADSNPNDTKGAVAQAVMATSKGGSVVYFAARGQLVPGEGRTYIQNLQGEGHANVYRYDGGAPAGEALAYVGTITSDDARNQALMTGTSGQTGWSSQTTADGSYFLYTSRDGFEIDNPAEAEMAHLFSSATGSTVCVSCPANGSPPQERPDLITTGGSYGVIPGVRGGSILPTSSLSESGRVIFNSEEVLAPGAVEGEKIILGSALWPFPEQTNIYEWNHGQVSTLATGTVEQLGMGGPDGRDVFIKSVDRLTGQDFDFTADVYDIRSGGGFPPPPSAPIPCEPVSGACQPSAGNPGAAATPTSAAFVGPGNPPVGRTRSKRCPKGKRLVHRRCVRKHKHRKHRSVHKRAHDRNANANRGGAR